MNLAAAVLNRLDQDPTTKRSPAELLALYQQRIYENKANADMRSHNVAMRAEDPRLIELRDGDWSVGPILIVSHGYHALTRAPRAWWVRCRATPDARNGRKWRISVEEGTDPRAILTALSARAAGG